jgi:hypothetical protein
MRMDRKDLHLAVAENSHLRGLYGVPVGLLAIFSALANAAWGPFTRDWFFGLAIIALAPLTWGIARHYNAHFGRATPSAGYQTRLLLAVVVCAPAAFFGSLLLSSRASWSLDLPVNTAAISMGLILLVICASTVGLRLHHVVVYGSLLVVGALPVWERGGMSGNAGLFMSGVAIIVGGLLDHRLLVQRFGRATLNGREGDRAGAS